MLLINVIAVKTVVIGQVKNYSTQNTWLDANINSNGTQAITGALLNQGLTDYLLINQPTLFYDTTRAYLVGQFTIYKDDNLFKPYYCTTNTSDPAGSFDATKWNYLNATDTLYIEDSLYITQNLGELFISNDVEINGNIDADTITGTGLSIVNTNGYANTIYTASASGQGLISQFPGSTGISNSLSGDVGSVTTSPGDVQVTSTDGVNSSGLTINLSKAEFIDNLNSKGVVYAADYSANYTDRSLVDKEYVDTRTIPKAYAYLDSNTTFVTVSTAGTWYQITGFTEGQENGIVLFDSDSIYVTDSGIYGLQFDPSMIKGAGGAAQFEFGFGINNVPPTTSLRTLRTVSSATDYGVAPIGRSILLSANDRIKLYVRNLSNTDDVKFVYGQFQVVKE